MPATFTRAVYIKFAILVTGVLALFRLVGNFAVGIFSHGGSLRSRLLDRLTSPVGLRLWFDMLRAFAPTLAFRRKIITAYDNNGTAFITGFDDVKDVLRRDQDFEVVYAPRMMQITGGENFFLGMQNSPRYVRDVSNMRLAVRPDDVSSIIRPFALQQATALVAMGSGRIDVPRDLTLPVTARLVARYFGVGESLEQDLIAWTSVIFWFLFADLNAEPDVARRALEAAPQLRAHIDNAIQARKRHPTDADDVLGRCLEMQTSGRSGTDDLDIRNNLVGIIIGAIPTISKAAVNALDQLLDRPEHLAGAQAAARSGDDALLAAYTFEALRFNPVSPIILRRVAHEAGVAQNTWRACKLRPGTILIVSNLSAMFDPEKLETPRCFRVDRPWDSYIHWGDGIHACFGAHINRCIIPDIIKPLLIQPGLRRAAGSAGSIDMQGTPFPVHFSLEFDR